LSFLPSLFFSRSLSFVSRSFLLLSLLSLFSRWFSLSLLLSSAFFSSFLGAFSSLLFFLLLSSLYSSSSQDSSFFSLPSSLSFFPLVSSSFFSLSLLAPSALSLVSLFPISFFRFRFVSFVRRFVRLRRCVVVFFSFFFVRSAGVAFVAVAPFGSSFVFGFAVVVSIFVRFVFRFRLRAFVVARISVRSVFVGVVSFLSFVSFASFVRRRSLSSFRFVFSVSGLLSSSVSFRFGRVPFRVRFRRFVLRFRRVVCRRFFVSFGYFFGFFDLRSFFVVALIRCPKLFRSASDRFLHFLSHRSSGQSTNVSYMLVERSGGQGGGSPQVFGGMIPLLTKTRGSLIVPHLPFRRMEMFPGMPP